jgi:RNA polymerase sigma-B factor
MNVTGKNMYESRGSRAVGRDIAHFDSAAMGSRVTAPSAPRTSEQTDERRHDACDVNELVRRFQDAGDLEALEAVMTAFDWLAVSCARRMHRRGEPIEDLEQVAREALLGAVSRFDVDRGVPFRAFAWATAAGVLRHHYRAQWQVRVPRGIQELHLTVVKAIEELTSEAGRAPTVDEIAAHVHADRDDVILALDVGQVYRVGSLDQPLNGERGHVQRDRALATSDETLESLAERIDVREMLASLPPRQRAIVMMRFFDGRTQLEIGESLGISQVHVSRLLRAAMASLRQRAGAA